MQQFITGKSFSQEWKSFPFGIIYPITPSWWITAHQAFKFSSVCSASCREISNMPKTGLFRHTILVWPITKIRVMCKIKTSVRTWLYPKAQVHPDVGICFRHIQTSPLQSSLLGNLQSCTLHSLHIHYFGSILSKLIMFGLLGTF